MNVFAGRELQEYLKSQSYRIFEQKRDCYDDLAVYLDGKADHRICCLYGLRRTGKTVMMLQAMSDRAERDRLFVQCEDGDTMQDLKAVLRSHPGAELIFIDEATKVHHFIRTSSILSDIFKTGQNRIVLSGTDSLGFMLAAGDELYDRAVMIHTTRISFREYHRLLGLDLYSYMRYGGTLTDGMQIYNADGLDVYTNSAIVGNIEHSAREASMPVIQRLLDEGILGTAVRQLIEKYNKDFLLQTVNASFVSHDIHSVGQILEERLIKEVPETPHTAEYLFGESLNSVLSFYLGIRNAELNVQEKELKSIETLLEKMDVIEKRPDGGFYFTQPGMRYCQIEQVLQNLTKDEAFIQYSSAEQQWIMEKLRQDVEGRMLEDIVLSDCAANSRIIEKYYVTKYQTPFGEYVMALIGKDGKSVIAEIKHSDTKNEQQTRHLKSEDLKASFERDYRTRIMAKLVLYNGETARVAEGILYLNVEEFLLKPEKFLCLSNISRNEAGNSSKAFKRADRRDR